MNTAEPKEPISIAYSISKLNKTHKQKLGFAGQNAGMLLILTFALALLPLYLFLLVFNKVYFWIRKQDNIDRALYFNHDRHNIPHLRFADKVWCEYCEWANGSLQWAMAITNEIERRYCPIQNKSRKHGQIKKEWRNDFLIHEHQPEDIDLYYQEKYLPTLLKNNHPQSSTYERSNEKREATHA